MEVRYFVVFLILTFLSLYWALSQVYEISNRAIWDCCFYVGLVLAIVLSGLVISSTIHEVMV